MVVQRFKGIAGHCLQSFRTWYINRQVLNTGKKFDPANPCFSVIIPIYDRTDELIQAIDSVLSQTFNNYEILLICDGSPTPTIDIVESYLNHPQIRGFFFQDNSGNPCRGRNKGIEMARGRFVAFLDSDDIAMSKRLERSLFHVLDKKVDGVGGAIEYLVDNFQSDRFINGQIGFTGESCTYDLLLQGNRLSICTVAVKRDYLTRFGGFRPEMRYREDHELWLRLAYHGCTFYNSPEIFARYRVHQDNAEHGYLENDEHWKQMVNKFYREDFNW